MCLGCFCWRRSSECSAQGSTEECQGTEQLRWLTGCVSEGFCLGRGDGAPGATPHEHSQGCTQAYQGYLTRVAAACPSRCVFWRREQLQACLLLILYGDSLDSMFRLLLSYLAGTAWRAFGFAAHHGRLHSTSDFLWVAVQGSLVAAVLSMVGAGWTLKTERKHGEAHSVRCVCPICAPEHYEQHVVEETEQHATGLHGQEVQHAEYRYVPVEPRLGFAVGAEIEMVEMDLEDELKEKLEGEEPAVERYELTI